MSNFFEKGLGRQNGVFGQGMSLMFESVKDSQADNKHGGQGLGTGANTGKENDEQMMLEAVGRAADEATRSTAAASVIEWAKAGDPSYDSFDDFAMAMAGIEDDEEDPTDEQIDEYNANLALMAKAAIAFGAKKDDVQAMIDDEDDTAAESVMNAIAGMDEDNEDSAITAFALKSDMLLESVVKVIRNGEVKLIKKNVRKRRISSAQRAALKKARAKAHTSAARVARAKSMKQRQRRGL